MQKFIPLRKSILLFVQFSAFRKERLRELSMELAGDKPVSTATRYYVCIPDDHAHQNHPTGIDSVFGQPIHPKLIEKIEEYVKAGILFNLEFVSCDSNLDVWI